MTLPVTADLKSYLRLETTDEDTLCDALLARAQAAVETYIGRPLVAVPDLVTVDEAVTQELYGRVTTLQTDLWPINAASVAVGDVDGVAVDPTTYRVVAARGQIVGLPGVSFVHGPYTITYTAGLSTDPFYATRIEPLASAAILDTAADLFQRRNPAATQEASGGGVSTSYAVTQLPERVCRMLDGLRLLAVSAL